MRTSSGLNTNIPVRPDEAQFRQHQRALENQVKHKLYVDKFSHNISNAVSNTKKIKNTKKK